MRIPGVFMYGLRIGEVQFDQGSKVRKKVGIGGNSEEFQASFFFGKLEG